MKKLVIFSLAALAMMACKDNKTENAEAEAAVQEEQELYDGSEYEKDGLYRIHRTPLTVQSEDGAMAVQVTPTADHSLPTVYSEIFERTYCDNRIRVVVTAGADTVFARTFTKSSFDGYYDASIDSKALLQQISCRSISGSAVKLQAEISVPHSEEESYVTMTIGRDGSMALERYTLEEVPDEMLD